MLSKCIDSGHLVGASLTICTNYFETLQMFLARMCMWFWYNPWIFFFSLAFQFSVTNFGWLVVLRLNVPVNNFSVISGRSHRFLGN